MALEPNKIHHLPVRITYTFGSQAAATPTPLYFSTGYGFPQLPSPTCVESTYTATCSGLIPVFVHDNDVARIRQSTRNKKVNKEEDCAVVDHLEEPQRGSVCLKSLVKAICLSSPEIIPSRNTEDLKIYINSPVNRQTPTRSSRQRRPQSTPFHQASTPGLSSTLSRSSSAIPEEVKTEPAQPSPWLGQHTEHSESQHAQWMSMSMYGHPSPYFPSIGHQLSTSYYHTALTKSQGQTEQVLHPKSTLATVLQEKGTGKTTVTGRLIPAELHILETIFDDLASNDSSATGVEALARQSQQAITAILEVELMLSAPISMDNLAHAQNMLTLDNERQVYHALGLKGESGVTSKPNQLLSQTDDSARSQPAASVKPEPAWPSSSSAIAKDNTTTTDLSSSSEGATFPATTSFRPFRPTSSKMALFEYQSRNRKSRREQHYTSDPSSMSRQNSPSNIFSRTRSRTRLGMGLTLEQVANVSNVVRLARKNPSALVERFLSGQTATSPIKRRSHGSGFTIDEVPRIVRVTPTVKTLNIATGSSKKRKTVSVVIDEAGRPIRWGVGAESPAKPTAITAVNQKSSQLNAHNAIKGDSMPSSGVTAIKKGPEYRAQFARNLPICYNCGITESGTWRTQGKGQRVCNACGLYWNSKGKVRPKELWEKDIARWNRRKAAKAKAAAANASAGGGAGRAATSATPAPKDMAIKAERKASTASNLPSKSSTSLNPIPNRLNVPTESSITTGGSGLKRNLSAVAEKEAQIHADSRRTQLTKARKEQLLNTDQTSTENTRTTEGNKENIPTRMSSNSGVLPSPLVNLGNSFKRENETPVKQQTTSILQSVNDNQPGSCEQVTPQLQRIKESPEAVLKRYLSETVFSLVPTNHLPLSDDGSRQSYGKSLSHSPATSATELGGEIGPIQDVDWGNVNDLAGLFKLSQSVESVGSVITTENQQQSQFSDPSIRVEHAQEQSDIAGSAVGDPHGSQPHEANLYQVNTDLPDSMDSEWEQLDPTSYNASSSSPACAPFDFSQLPPSSPPVVPTNDDELDQAAFWMSSPLTSPVDFGTISEKEVSPLKKVMNDLGDGVQDADAYDQAEALELISQAL
ncbi:hypothetical protein QFC21_005390 [Naganishia friedmannii]|uniref:Uncharacterized protein n=1 Tax=Naganishia friedmannii TaxID=89922 RepID=A0ACC2VBM1_9TREE|nr:hypothetical protein QFC21_005390 [Naganishia friedmannii]